MLEVRGALSCCLLLGCHARPTDHGDEAASDGISDTVVEDMLGDDGDDEPDLPGCDPIACMNECARDYDECINPMVGTCVDDETCVCERSPDCLLCSEQDCGPYETCGYGEFPGPRDYGECNLPCSYGLQYFWDPVVGCTIALPEDFPPVALPFFFVRVDGTLPRVDDCDPDQPEAFMLDEQGLIVSLCGEACTLFESVGELETGWAVNCE